MRLARRAKRRFTGKARVQLPAPRSAQLTVVIDGELHEQLVGLLPIVDGVPVAHLGSREQTQRSTARNRPRLGTEHRPNAKPAAREAASGGEHAPIQASCLTGPGTAGSVAITRLVESL